MYSLIGRKSNNLFASQFYINQHFKEQEGIFPVFRYAWQFRLDRALLLHEQVSDQTF
jgi:hypothetical protein